MNKRIRELAEQAGMTDDKYGMFFAKDKHNEDGVDLEKFTELIVRECLNQCYNRGMNSELYDGQLKAAAYIEQHFGVEE